MQATMNTCIKVPEFVTQIHFQKASYYDCGVFSSNKIRGLHLKNFKGVWGLPVTVNCPGPAPPFILFGYTCLQKSFLAISCLQNKGHRKVLNGTKLILKDFEWPLHYLGSIRYHSKNPIFHKRETYREIFCKHDILK